jgi:ribonuclease BN (tRNA processing enzyme)
MKLRVLGASGGIGAQARTTSLLLDNDILIDAGTGVGDLTLPELAAVDHIFLTHSHLDHVAALPLLLDTVGASRPRPVVVHAQEPTLAALRAHVFNNVIWPDFNRIPTPQAPFMTYAVLPPGATTELGSRRIRSIAVTHAVPAVGYLLSGPGGSLAFSGDTTVTEEFWRVLSACPDLRHLIIETSFLDADAELSRVSRHLCPAMLAGELKKLGVRPQIHITHLLPGREDEIMAEIVRQLPDRKPRRLLCGEILDF